MNEFIIGLSDGHDAGACLVDLEGKLLYAASEERFTRKKHQRGIPKFSLSQIKASIPENDAENIKLIAIAGIFRKERRLLELKKYLEKEFPGVPFTFFDHHLCHAASAFHTSGFDQSLVITLDAAGDGLSGSISVGKKGRVTVLHTISYLDSIGDFFASITDLLGYKPMSDEHKVASMAAHAPNLIPDEELKCIIDYDSSRLSFVNGLEVVGHRATRKLKHLLGKHDHFTIARSAQEHLIKLVSNLMKDAHDLYGIENVSFAGGVAGNVQLNMIIAESENVKDLWVFPHMGDGGLCVGAALEALARIKQVEGKYLHNERLGHVYLGPEITKEEIEKAIQQCQDIIKIKTIDSEEIIPTLLNDNKFIGLIQGRMEFGPRALGNRSLLANPSIADNQRVLNIRKGRPWFQPFAPSILLEHAAEYLVNPTESPFMTRAFRVTDTAVKRVPAVIHADKTTRPQTVSNENPRYRKFIEQVLEHHDFPLILNTSLNLHGMPIVNSATDGIILLKKNLIDVLILKDYLITKKK